MLRVTAGHDIEYPLRSAGAAEVTRDALRRLSDQLDGDQADEDKPRAAGPGQPGIE
jgi:hypothetical protein